MNTNGGSALIRSLELEGVEVIFGLPGGAILPVYDPILDSPIRHVLVRHEQGAGHMAEGFAHATGRPGVAMVTSGPGATNIVTPLADAYMDSVPMVVHHRTGADRRDRHRCLPGVRHRRHHPWGDQAQRAGDPRRGHPARDPPGVPHRHHRPPGPGAGRHPQGHRRSDEPELGDGLVLAQRRRRLGQPAGLQADHEGPSAPDQGRRRAHRRGATDRCSTPVAASSRHALRRRCASWPS